MRLPRILPLYLLREVLTYGALGFTAVCTLMVSQNLLRSLDELIAVGSSPAELAAMIRLMVPMLASYAVPVSFLFGVLVAVGRLASDSEITAMRACGMGLRGLLVPVLLLGVLVSALTAHLMIQVEHRARRDLSARVLKVAARGGFLEPGRFHAIGPRVVYVRDRQLHELDEVLIFDAADPKQPFVIVAESGRFSVDPEQGRIDLRLSNGDIHLEPQSGADERYRRISFSSFDYAFDASSVLTDLRGHLRPSEMSIRELRAVLERARAGDPLLDLRSRNPSRYLEQIHRRFALPVAPILFALIGVPLGLSRARGTRSWGVLLGLALAFSYYLLLSFGQFLTREGLVQIPVAFWLPNAIFAAAGIYLVLAARRVGG